jgi:hypothetical protein
MKIPPFLLKPTAQDAKPELLSNEMALEEENLSAAQIIRIVPIHRTSNKRVIKRLKALIRFFGDQLSFLSHKNSHRILLGRGLMALGIF